MDYRNLNPAEINALGKQGCCADNWSEVLVVKDFLAQNIINVHFAGNIKLGCFKEKAEVEKGVFKQSGLYNCYIQNCSIGDNTYISDVRTLVNYNILNNVIIQNTATIITDGKSTFGNGTEITVLNEGGGRELLIYDKLSSQVAYLMVNYRHDKRFIDNLSKMIKSYAEKKKSHTGTIKNNVKINDCLTIRNVNIDEHTCIHGASLLENGTIASCKEDIVSIGEGVIARNFIILSGSEVESNSIIDKCFIGQGVKIGKQYSAENSVFFANSEGFHGEACNIFAGPYTVTHHKSTILIAGLFSFYNAGSGTNQSNHLYKLGPVHQGILERGCKTGSSSYMLWPCHVGAFSIIAGKHKSNMDTSDFPFSYILESEGKSLLIPAVNLFTIGTKRDSIKWPLRDRRKAPVKYDLLNFELLTPYTIEKILRGMDVLKTLDKKTIKTQPLVNYKGIYIKRQKLKEYYSNYETAVSIYIGNQVVKKLKKAADINSFRNNNVKLQDSKWVDISGMFAPYISVERLIKSIQNNKTNSIKKLTTGLNEIHNNFDEMQWQWCLNLIYKRYNISSGKITAKHLKQIISEWEKSYTKFNSLILKDIMKEFAETSKIAFGIDGTEEIREADFEAVRGSFDRNKFAADLTAETISIQKKARGLIEILKK